MSTSVYTGLPCINVCHHSSTGLYRSLSAQRLSERTVFLWHGVQLILEVTVHPQALPMQMWMLFIFIVPEQENILWADDIATGWDSCGTKTTQCSTYETMWMCSTLSVTVNYLKIQVILPSYCEWGQEAVIQVMYLYNTLYNSTWILFLDIYIVKMKALLSFKISGNAHPMTQHNIAGDFIIQYHSVNWKYCDVWILWGPYFVWPISLVTSCQPLHFIELGWLADLPKPDLLYRSCYMSVGVMSFCSGRGNILFQNCMYNRPTSFAGLHVMVLLICGRIIVLHVTDIPCLIRYCYSCSVIILRTSMQIHMYFKVGHNPCRVLHQ